MDLFQALVLGILQGATEFLPISSSGHLVLVPWLLKWEPSNLAFDAIVHWGTAGAVVVYFWSDWVALVSNALRSLPAILRNLRATMAGKPRPENEALSNPDGMAQPALGLLWLIILGTIPAALLGYLLEDFFERMFSRPAAAAGFLLVTAAVLTASERVGRRELGIESLTWLDALLVGLAQALAIFPGISRSGATIAAGLTRSLRREAAARFSFLLATPVILGAGLLKVLDLAQVGELAAQVPAFVVGFAAAGVVGYACIHFLLRYLERRKLYPFAIYCAAAGMLCLLVALVRGG